MTLLTPLSLSHACTALVRVTPLMPCARSSFRDLRTSTFLYESSERPFTIVRRHHCHHRCRDCRDYQDCQHCRRQWQELYLYRGRWRYVCDMKVDSLYSRPWSYRFTMVSTFVPGQAAWTASSSTIQERGEDREIRQKKKGIAMTYCSKGLRANSSCCA